MGAPSSEARQLYLGNRGGLILKPLVWGPEPVPISGESLLGLVARTAARNAFSSMHRVLRLAGIERRNIGALPVLDMAGAERLARLLRVDESEIVSRVHLRIPVAPRRTSTLVFFDAAIRENYRETFMRRVSPRSLKASPHHRAMWDLRPFSFCPDSLEMLIGHCPVCSRRLGWRTTYGVQHCEACVDGDGVPSVDLRDYPQPLVEIADEAALTFICDVVHTDPDRRARAKRVVAPEFVDVSPGALFETVLAIATVITAKPGSVSGKLSNSGSLEGYTCLTPEALARASRALMTWPSAYCEIADGIRADAAKRVGFIGFLKEVGGLATLSWNQELPAEVRTILTKGNEAVLARLDGPTTALARLRKGIVPEGYITQKEAGRRLGMRAFDVRRLASHPKTTVLRMTDAVGGPILYRADEIEHVAQARSDLVRDDAVALRLGMPLWAVHDLIDKGYLVIEDGPVAALLGNGMAIRSNSVDALVTAMTQRLKPVENVERVRNRLISVVRKATRTDMPWVVIVEAILDGSLELQATDNARASFTANVTVIDLDCFATLVEQAQPDRRACSVPITDREASVALGTTSFTVGKLVDAGILAANGSRERRIEADAITAFRKAYAFTPEVAAFLKTKNADVRKRMRERGVEPVVEFGEAKRLVWLREAVFA